MWSLILSSSTIKPLQWFYSVSAANVCVCVCVAVRAFITSITFTSKWGKVYPWVRYLNIPLKEAVWCWLLINCWPPAYWMCVRPLSMCVCVCLFLCAFNSACGRSQHYPWSLALISRTVGGRRPTKKHDRTIKKHLLSVYTTGEKNYNPKVINEQ